MIGLDLTIIENSLIDINRIYNNKPSLRQSSITYFISTIGDAQRTATIIN